MGLINKYWLFITAKFKYKLSSLKYIKKVLLMKDYKKFLVIFLVLVFSLIFVKPKFVNAPCATDADCGSGYYCSGNLQNVCTHKCLSGSCIDDCPTFCNNGCSNGACNAVLANTCSSSNPMYCYTQSECTAVGAQWCSTYC